jgi:hypothetical protein
MITNYEVMYYYHQIAKHQIVKQQLRSIEFSIPKQNHQLVIRHS